MTTLEIVSFVNGAAAAHGTEGFNRIRLEIIREERVAAEAADPRVAACALVAY